MSKVVRAANAMILHKEKIGKILAGPIGDEYYFIYDRKHRWSIKYDDNNDDYWLYYYPGDKDLDALCYEVADADFTEFVNYSAKGLGTLEAFHSLRELYQTVKEKMWGMDEVLDEIIE